MDSEEKENLLRVFPGILKNFSEESDRGVVLVVASMVEKELEKQIVLRLLPKAEAQDELLSKSATSPISTFSSKIDLAFRTGLITTSERTIFHQLRKIRNRCAHDIDSQDFDKNHLKDRMRNIINAHPEFWNIMSQKIVPEQIEAKFESVEHYLNTLGWRIAFEAFFGMIISHKRVSYQRIPRINALSVSS